MIPQPDFINSQFLISAITFTIVVHIVLLGCAYCIYFERKTSAWMQDRLGPNRAGLDFGLQFFPFNKLKGLFGLGQPLADGIKFMLKEDYTPPTVDKGLFTLAPMVVVIPALMGFAIVPWGGYWDMPQFTVPFLDWTFGGERVLIAAANINIGLIYLLAVASLGIYGIALGSWASNNKYSFLGGLRASSQMLSYEIPMGLSLLAVLLFVGSLKPIDFINHQAEHGWLIISHPIAAILFFMCGLAECNRAPFDNAECEQELVGGYHTEYSSMRFALFFLAEYAHMITTAAIFAVVFLGGYNAVPFVQLPFLGVDDVGIFAVLAKFGVMFVKIALLIGFMMVIRWTLPRLRFDQVMRVAWQGVIPISVVLLMMNATLVFFGGFWTSLPGTLLANLVLAAAVVLLQPVVGRAPNRKIRMAGSRFYPLEDGPGVKTRPTLAAALEDRPIQTAATLGAS